MTNLGELRLRRTGKWWRSEWALVDGSSQLVRFESRGWSGNEMRLVVDEQALLSRPVLLFTAWLVASLVRDDNSAAAGASAAVVAAGS
jgi:hypothetical protein